MFSENVWTENVIETKAALIIQRTWRRHIDVHVYKYYRDLINFKCRGNPGDMLRCINPNEAKLLDAASGITVRFRLAGERFPPNIYYKIFTNRPIQDLCANSPKDYTDVTTKQLSVKDTHGNSRIQRIQLDDKKGWYKRRENNGWRLVSDRHIHHILSDPFSLDVSKKIDKFDHSRLQRKRDVERQKKHRKIEWMKKMYKEGMLKAKTDDKEVLHLVDGAVAGMIATVNAQGPEALEDWEVDELLDWTTGLNFDDYRDTWTALATSASSQKLIEDRMKLSLNIFYPNERTDSSELSHYASAQQSQVTSVTVNSTDSSKLPIQI